MFLKSIEAQGFKSFPDKTLLKFDQGITAVVGPNGSGKSNISDAIRWVLGEQSNKQLRSAKSEDVIFNGTASRKPQTMAQVTICFDNSDHTLPCDSEEVFVTRRYYRSGESEYRINHASVRLKDVNELFMDTGIGRDGYSMIGQGKIADIVSRQSGERRDMFEEAAGISRYRYRKMEAERKLTSTEENLVRLRDILSELEARVGPLAEQSEKAKKFLELSGQKKDLEIGLWLRSLERYKDKLREQETKIALASSQYIKVQEEIDASAAEIEETARLAQQLTVEMDESRRACAFLEEQAVQIDGQIAVHENNIHHNEENIDRIRRDMEESSGSGEVFDEQIAAYQAAADEQKEQVLQKRAALEASALSLEKLLNENTAFSQKSEELNRLLAELAAQLSDCQVRAVTAASSCSEITARLTSVAQAKEKTLAQEAELQDEAQAIEGDAASLAERIAESKNAENGLQLLCRSRQQKCEDYKKAADELTLEAATARRRAILLTDMENSMEGFGNSVKTVMLESKKGALSGIHGPVSRLISVDDRYAVAVEVALGAALQNIVVETDADAKRAIRYLKNEKAGRATFLPVQNIRPRRFSERGLSDCPGFLGMADTLITFDKKYENIFSSLLGGIAVAEDLDTAAAIAKKYEYRFRIVSLDGQVVNTGGSLTGGSFSRHAGLLSRAGEIEKLNQEAALAEQKASEAAERFENSRRELTAKEAELDAVRAELTTANEDQIRLLSEQKRVLDRLDELKNALDEMNREQSGANSRLEALRTEQQKAEVEAEGIRTKIEENNRVLAEVSDGSEGLSKRREELTEQNAALRMEIISLEKEAESALSMMESVRQQKSSAAGKLTEFSAQISALEESNRQEREEIESCRTAAADLRARAAQGKEQVEQSAQQRLSLDARAAELRAAERDLTAQRERLGGENARLEERRDSVGREYEEIIKKLFDEYELTRSQAEELEIDIGEPAAAGRKLAEIKQKIRALGTVNVAAIEEYSQVSERYEFLKTQIGDVENSKKELEKLIGELQSNMQVLFTDKFREIRGHFQTTFLELFGGGTADLLLTDEQDVLNCGIDIRVQPPGKNVASIEQLSGGEKSLVAIAIYFAMMKVSPPPFCMLDEVESALDDINVDRFAAYLRRMCSRTQYIVITHRRGSMEEADVLYGVTMQEKGVSKFLKLNVAEAEKTLQTAAAK